MSSDPEQARSAPPADPPDWNLGQRGTYARLAAWFLVIALVPLGGMGYAAYVAYRDTIQQTIVESLTAAAAARARQVESYIEERRHDAAGLASLPALAGIVTALESADRERDDAPRVSAEAEAGLRSLVNLYVGERGYRDLTLLAPDGRVLFDAVRPEIVGTSIAAEPLRGGPLQHGFLRALQGGGVEVSPVGPAASRSEQDGPTDSLPRAFLVAPILRGGRLLGAVALELDWQGVTRILEPRVGFGHTGEVFLGARHGGRVLFATPLRYAPSDGQPRIPLGSPLAQAMQAALLGERGAGIAADYRGTPALAAWRRLPTLGWGLVVKIDAAEAFRPIERLRRWALLIGAAAALLAAAVGLWVARSFARPLVALTEVTRRFAAGDFRQRTRIRSADEIGALARSIDSMADSLVESRERLEQTIAALLANNDALTASEARFRQLAENIDVAFWTLDLGDSPRFSYVSPAWERITGQSSESLDTDPELWVRATHPDDRERVLDAWWRGAQGPSEVVFRMYRADASLRWLRSRAVVVTGDDGHPQRIAGVVEDITERRRAEDALRASEQMFRRLAETTHLVPWEADARTWRFSYVGPQAEQLLGHAPEAWLDPGFWAARIHPEDRDAVLALFEHSCAELEHFDLEYRMIAADGRCVWVQDVASVVRATGEATLLRGFLIDVTHRKEAEAVREELLERSREAQRRAEEASRLKDDFLATLSHELRTPLNAILGWSEVLEEGDSDGDTAQRAIETIARNARSQAKLIEDLLDISRIMTGRLRLETRPIGDLQAIVEAAVDSLRLAAEAKQIDVQVAAQPRLGPILGDPVRLQQVVWNLVSNAVKFTPRGGEVHITLDRDGACARLVVRDTGEGIRSDFLPYVFDRFRQGDGGSTRTHGGLGLGLAIVRQLAELHGGEVAVTSRGPGLGATFTVRLPLMATQGASRESRRPADPVLAESARREAPSLAGLRVVAVDDEPDSLALIRTVLERARAHVDTATTAADALHRLAESRFDLLIADVGMPERDGYWLIRRVRELAPDLGGTVPAMALTAYARPEDRASLLAAGFQVHLAKPVTPDELTRAVADMVRRSSVQQGRSGESGV